MEPTTDVLAPFPETSRDLRAMDTEALREELYNAIGITVRAIKHVAAIWTELEARGEDLSDVRFALASYMRPVQSGRLLPEAVAQLAGRRRTLDLVATLPVDDQRRLIEGQAVEVVKGQDETVEKNLDQMTFSETAAVIRDGMIRTVDEQRLALKRMGERRPRRRRGRKPRIAVDGDNATVTVGTVTVALDDLVASLRAAGVLDR